MTNKTKSKFHKLKKTEKKVDDLTHPSHSQTKTYTIHIIVVALLELRAVKFDKILERVFCDLLFIWKIKKEHG